MQSKFFGITLFALLLLSISSMPLPVEGATLGKASLQGSYFFTLEKIDTSVLGFSFLTAVGAISFDGNGKASVQGSINRNGSIQSLVISGTYDLAPSGAVSVSLPDVPFSVGGKVSFDVNAIVATNVSSGSVFTQDIFLASKLPSPLLSSSLPSSLPNGRYFLSERTITASGSTPQLESASGTLRFDGQGNCAVDLSSNRAGTATTVSGAGTYQIEKDGSVSLKLPGKTSVVHLGFSPDGNMAVGATLDSQSGPTHDLYAISKASSDGLGNGSVNGSYEIVVGSWNNSAFSTAMVDADYFGDGNVSYQQVAASSSPAKAGSILIDAGGNLQFIGLPGAPGSFRGGAGFSGHTFLASGVADPATYNFLLAIRTPIQPSAVVNAATFSADRALSPGALVTIFGRNLARQVTQASSLPLPTTAAGVSVKIGGVAAPLLFVSPFQLNVQVPFETPPSPTNLTVTLDGAESAPLPITISNAGPGIFTLSSSGTGGGIFLHGADFTLVTKSSPARPGEVVLIYATGLGAVVPAVASGVAAPTDPLAAAVASVSVQINGADAGTPSFAGLAPGFVGLYQVNFAIPAGIAAPGDVPVIVTAAGVQSNSVTMPVAP